MKLEAKVNFDRFEGALPSFSPSWDSTRPASTATVTYKA